MRENRPLDFESRSTFSVVPNENNFLNDACSDHGDHVQVQFQLIGGKIISELCCNVSEVFPSSLQACGLTDPTRSARSIGWDGALPTIPCRVLHCRHYGAEGGKQRRHGTLHGVCRLLVALTLNRTWFAGRTLPRATGPSVLQRRMDHLGSKDHHPSWIVSPSDLHARMILIHVLQIRLERHPEACHYLQMQPACATANTVVDFAGTPIRPNTPTLLP